MTEKNDKEKFYESQKLFSEWNKQAKRLVGFCLWKIEFAGFVLEAWNDIDKKVVIFQIFANAGGFIAYTQDTEYFNED